MSNKLQVTRLTQMIHEQDLCHGLSSRLCGAQLETDLLVKRKTSQEEECPCIEFVYIILDKNTSEEQHHPVEKSLRPCVGSASTIKLM